MPQNSRRGTLGDGKGSQAKTVSRLEYYARLVSSLSSYAQFKAFLSQRSSAALRSPGKILYDVAETIPGCHELLGSYYQQALNETSSPTETKRARAARVLAVLQNLGIGEVVFVAPEGPQATAGGMAQVVTGLMKSFEQIEIPTTLISFLYEEEKGREHLSAAEILDAGLLVDGERVPLIPAGHIEVPFGPTRRPGSEEIARPGETVRVAIYVAEKGLQRMFFIRHPRFTERLYPHVDAEQQIRNAILLSRGALEILRKPELDLEPHFLISNDWMAGLVPAFLKTDPVYASDHRLSKVQTMHVLHNCGVDYQGRFATSQYGIDLWPMLGLAPEHYFGISDPEDRFLLNLTAAAVFHVGKAVLTVSRPYAEELLSGPQSGGLSSLMRSKKNILFGISNGVDTERLQRTFAVIRRRSQRMLSRRTGAQQERKRPGIKKEKAAAKALVQKEFELAVEPGAVLVSLVGRLTEQKGVGLFLNNPPGKNLSVLEILLTQYPKLQVLIAGPGRRGEPLIERLSSILEDCRYKFPDRVCSTFNFLPHDLALTITRGSDLFLMPSRYEPGGIVQLEALAAGTPVVARNVGGIAATLVDVDADPQNGNAFLFEDYNAGTFLTSVCRALDYIADEGRRERLTESALRSEHDWNDRMPKYRALFQHAAGVTSAFGFSEFDAQRELLDDIRPAPDLSPPK